MLSKKKKIEITAELHLKLGSNMGLLWQNGRISKLPLKSLKLPIKYSTRGFVYKQFLAARCIYVLTQ